MTQQFFERKNPNGTTTLSTTPFPPVTWWDNPFLHPVWSYASWATQIAFDFGYVGPRIFFARLGWFDMPSEKKIASRRARRSA